MRDAVDGQGWSVVVMCVFWCLTNLMNCAFWIHGVVWGSVRLGSWLATIDIVLTRLGPAGRLLIARFEIATLSERPANDIILLLFTRVRGVSRSGGSG